MFEDRLVLLIVVLVVTVTAPALAVTGTTPSAREGTSPSVQDEGDQVTVQRFSVETLRLRNVTITDAVVRNLTVRNLQTENGTRENVTLRNVSAQRIHVERAELLDVTFENMTIQNRQLLTNFGFTYARGGNVTNESRAQVAITNRTLSGVLVENLVVQNASEVNIEANATRGDVTVDRTQADFTAGEMVVESIQSFEGFSGNATDTETETTAVGETTTATANETETA